MIYEENTSCTCIQCHVLCRGQKESYQNQNRSWQKMKKNKRGCQTQACSQIVYFYCFYLWLHEYIRSIQYKSTQEPSEETWYQEYQCCSQDRQSDRRYRNRFFGYEKITQGFRLIRKKHYQDHLTESSCPQIQESYLKLQTEGRNTGHAPDDPEKTESIRIPR